jgi:hypothetical protein
VDAYHQATDLAVRPWRCWPLPHLAGPPLVGHRGGGGRLCCRLSAWRCRRSARRCRRRGCPQRRACGCRCPQAASSVRASGPSMSAGCADLARTQQVTAEPDTAAVSAVRLGVRPGAGRTAAVHRGHGRSPEQGGTPRPPVADRPCMPADCGSGHRAAACGHCQGGRGALRNCGHLAMPSGRLDGGRGAGVRSAAELDAVSVGCPPLLPKPWPVSGRPVSAQDPAPSAGVRCYRNRSPGRRLLDGWRHCR